jgi:predicted DNA-binding transcriptional regulator AlpA
VVGDVSVDQDELGQGKQQLAPPLDRGRLGHAYGLGRSVGFDTSSIEAVRVSTKHPRPATHYRGEDPVARMTLERVAELAGVSRSTASRVINGQDGVRPELRRRVLAVIEDTGFVPHAAARSLAGQRSRILGLVIPETTEQVFSDPYFGALIQGVSRACNAHEQTLSLFLFQTTPTTRSTCRPASCARS